MTRLPFAELAARGSLLVNDGYRTKTTELGSTGFPILRVAEIDAGGVVPSYTDHVREEFRSKIGYKLSCAGDVLLTTKGTVGRRAIMPGLDAQFAYSPQLCFFRVLDDSVDGRWLYYWLGGTEFWSQAAGVSQQTDMAPYISLRDLRAIEIDLPPIEEQRGIAAPLGALDDKIQSNRYAQTLIEQLVQARFGAAFSVEDEPRGVPISSIVEVNPRRTLGRGQLATYVGMSSLPEHAAEVTDWAVKEFGSGQKFINGDVLMARITPCLENGKTAMVDMLQVDEVGWGSTEYVVLAPRGEISTPWIYCMARSESVRAFAIRSMTGTSGRQRFQANGFDNYRITNPDQGALREFNAEALPLFARMTALRDENRVLARLRDALLPELLSGRIRVPEAWAAVDENTRSV